MDPSQPERSLSGISLPRWMKSKIADRYDLEQSAFSPPTDDDNFFFIPYPKAKSMEPQPIKSSNPNANTMGHLNFCTLNEALENHTIQCRQFIPQAKTTPHEIGLRKAKTPPLGRIKSTGTDDGFKGPGAACGQSVVAVAHQMISSKIMANQQSASHSDDENISPASFSANNIQRQRRNSKSLPATPGGSPKLVHRNPYFTSLFVSSTDKVEKAEHKTSGWLTSMLMKKDSQEELIASDDSNRVSDHEEPTDSPPVKTKLTGSTYRVKPSEYREMNFWSPTSM